LCNILRVGHTCLPPFDIGASLRVTGERHRLRRRSRRSASDRWPRRYSIAVCAGPRQFQDLFALTSSRSEGASVRTVLDEPSIGLSRSNTHATAIVTGEAPFRAAPCRPPAGVRNQEADLIGGRAGCGRHRIIPTPRTMHAAQARGVEISARLR
jgi:hypothetical protein